MFPQWFARLISPRPADGIFDEFDASVDRLLTERGRAPDAEPKDLLARLIAARDAETGGGMTAEEVRDQVVTIFMAGHETTAQALAWTWYLLSQHPAAEAQAARGAGLGAGGRTPRIRRLANLRYTRMVIEESMRLYPPAHTIGREPIAADDILGHRIPAGSTVLIVPWLLHRKPSLWDEPDRFDARAIFGGARRGAAALRLHSVRRRPAYLHRRGVRHVRGILILATIAQRYRLRLKPGHPVEPQGLITLRPRYGLPMILERRQG